MNDTILDVYIESPLFPRLLDPNVDNTLTDPSVKDENETDATGYHATPPLPADLQNFCPEPGYGDPRRSAVPIPSTSHHEGVPIETCTSADTVSRETAKEIVRERYREKKKSMYDCIFMSPDGSVCETTVNTSFGSYIRYITNISTPQLTKLICNETPGHACLRLDFYINAQHHELFINPQKLGNQNYLTKKLTLAGIQILKDRPTQRIKTFTDIINLLSCNADQEIIPHRHGWIKYGDESTPKFTYCGEETKIWADIELMMK